MTGLVRKATLLSVFGLLVACAAFANVPDPAHSPIPAYVDVVGRFASGAVPDGLSPYNFVVRDFANNPISGSHVVIDFSQCCDINICQYIVAGQTFDCATQTVAANTDATGAVSIKVVGAAKHNSLIVPGPGPEGVGQYPGAGALKVKVIADGVVLGNATGVCKDLDGASAVGAASNGPTAGDISEMIKEVGSIIAGHTYKGRTDENHDGACTAADVSREILIVGAYIANNGLGCKPNAYCTVKLTPGCPLIA